MKSRALVRLGKRKFEIRELDVPEEPIAGGAILRVLANGICGSDYDEYVGRLPGNDVPTVPGHEPVGRIEAIDPAAAELWGVSEGDRVAVEGMIKCGLCRQCRLGRGKYCTNATVYSHMPVERAPGLWGGMSEYMMLLPGTSLYRVPEGLSDEDAVLFNPVGNAFEWTARSGQVQAGDRVLVLGSGQRGIACAAVAATLGARQIIITGLSRDAEKLALAREFGATDTLDVEQQDTVATVMDMTEGEGVDVAIDATPAATDPILHAMEVLRPEGRLVLAGIKGRETTLNTDLIEKKVLNLVGSRATVPWDSWNALELVSSRRFPFEKLHSHRVGLDDVEHALQVLGGEVPDETAMHVTVIPNQ